MTAKSALVEFQRQIYQDLQSELRQNLGQLPSSLRRYHYEYRREFFTFKSLSSLSELLKRIESCNIVYCGDYHTLRQAQLTNLALLQEIVRKRKIVLCTELIFSHQQPLLDRFMAGQISESEFLRNVRYRQNFGFAWNNYRPIFEFARSHQMRVIAIDGNPSSSREPELHERDQWAARIIAKATQQIPDRLLWVIIGDLHLARTHLPGYVQKELADRGTRRKVLVIHQNNEQLFWKVARHGLRGNMDIIKMDANAYCILNTPPWLKLYSYVSWLEQNDRSGIQIRVAEEFYRVVACLAEFLKITDRHLLDFTVYAGSDCSFLSEFAANSPEYHRCKLKFESGESFVVPARRIVYLKSTHMNHVAEIAARYIHAFCSGYEPKNIFSRKEMFRRVAHQALGFVGSKILNHHRRPAQSPALAKIILGEPYQSLLNSSKRYVPARALHLSFLLNGTHGGIRMIDFVGNRLGERIYESFVAEQLSIRKLRNLFRNPLNGNQAENLLSSIDFSRR